METVDLWLSVLNWVCVIMDKVAPLETSETEQLGKAKRLLSKKKEAKDISIKKVILHQSFGPTAKRGESSITQQQRMVI